MKKIWIIAQSSQIKNIVLLCSDKINNEIWNRELLFDFLWWNARFLQIKFLFFIFNRILYFDKTELVYHVLKKRYFCL